MEKMIEKQILLLAYAPLFFVSYLVTNVAIVANALRHWNDVNSNCSQGHTTQTEVSHVSGTASTEEVGRMS